MKILILAGGLGTRISEETAERPKPMVQIGDKPILWHIMNIFAGQGFKDFVVAAGYKSHVIHQWKKSNEVEFDLNKWEIEILDTGVDSQTGLRVRTYLEKYPNETFLLTYGDGLANINITKLINFHKNKGTVATVTAVRPPARFGVLEINEGRVSHFGEKMQTDSGWINGGFMVLGPETFKYITSENEPFETGALPRMTKDNELSAYKHFDFWKPMDTLREKNELESLYLNSRVNEVPWLKID